MLTYSNHDRFAQSVSPFRERRFAYRNAPDPQGVDIFHQNGRSFERDRSTGKIRDITDKIKDAIDEALNHNIREIERLTTVEKAVEERLDNLDTKAVITPLTPEEEQEKLALEAYQTQIRDNLLKLNNMQDADDEELTPEQWAMINVTLEEHQNKAVPGSPEHDHLSTTIESARQHIDDEEEDSEAKEAEATENQDATVNVVTISCREVLTTLQNNQSEIQKIIDEITAMDPAIRKKCSPEELQRWDTFTTGIEGAHTDLEHAVTLLEGLEKWEKGMTSPEELKVALEELIIGTGGDPTQHRCVDKLDEIINNDADLMQPWRDNEDINQRMNAVAAITDRIQLEEIYVMINDASVQVMDSAGNVRSILTEIQDRLSRDQKNDDSNDEQGYFRIRFYSLYQIGKGCMQIGKAYKERWNEWNNLKAAEFAAKYGKVVTVLPGGKLVYQGLRSTLDRASDEIKDRELGRLKNNRPDFLEIFQEGGLLKQNSKDTNLSRAYLEYAASRGWLYDLTNNRNNAFGQSIDAMLPGYWDAKQKDNYKNSLVNQNNDGASKEMSNGKTRGLQLDKTDLHIAALSESLEKVNIWEAQGIMAAAMERGLSGEVSPRLAVTLLKAIANNPTLRSYIHYSSAFDDMGKLSMYNTCPTLGFVKAERSDLNDWAKDPSKGIEKAGSLGKVIHAIEERIFEIKPEWRDSNNPKIRNQLEHAVAKVLATQTLVFDNDYSTAISIFDNDPHFNQYRNHTMWVATVPASVAKEDPDFFNNAADNILGKRGIVEGILRISNGEFSNKALAEAYLSQYIKHDREQRATIRKLRASNTGTPEEEARIRFVLRNWQNFITESRQKLTEMLRREILDGRVDKLSQSLTSRFVMNTEQPVIALLVKHGLMDESVINEVANKNGAKGQSFAKAVQRQVAKLRPVYNPLHP